MSSAESGESQEAIVRTALDYYEGWFDGDAARMERALHPELVKRTVRENTTTAENDSAQDMIEATAAGFGRKQDPGDRRISVHVDHVHGRIATATVTSAVYVDYLQLVEIDGAWKILNALWAKA
jgi:hypothetical protein